MISAKIWPENGAISEGFSTMVQPVASAGATLQAIWFSGQFHGVISAQTPIGSLTIRVVPRVLLEHEGLQHLDRRGDVAKAGAHLGALGQRRRARPSPR